MLYICRMKLTDKQLKTLKTKLALEGVGSKKRLAEQLGCKQSQLSYVLATGLVSNKLDRKLLTYIG